MIKVSIIVPVYNAKNTLINCVNSLINQTLQDIEIILVNDCSTDNSLLIMQLLEEKYPEKILIIDSNINTGAGGARNIGLEYVRGEYIGFVDSDDEVAPTMFEKLYLKAKEGDYDIVDCGFYQESEDRAIIFTSDELSGELDGRKRSELIVAGGYICTKIFRTSYWKKHSLRFREKAILEDSEIIAYTMATAKNIGNVKEVLYNYKDTPGSSSKTPDTKWYVDNCFNAMSAIYSSLAPLDNYDEIKEAAEYEILQLYSYAINMLHISIKKDGNTFQNSELGRLRDFRKQFISAGYDNHYVKAKISYKDIQLMEQNDK